MSDLCFCILSLNSGKEGRSLIAVGIAKNTVQYNVWQGPLADNLVECSASGKKRVSLIAVMIDWFKQDVNPSGFRPVGWERDL